MWRISAFSQLYIKTNKFFPITSLLKHWFFLILYHSALNIFAENIWRHSWVSVSLAAFSFQSWQNISFRWNWLILSGSFVTLKSKTQLFLICVTSQAILSFQSKWMFSCSFSFYPHFQQFSHSIEFYITVRHSLSCFVYSSLLSCTLYS